MSKPFDATTKHLVEAGPIDWVRLCGFPGTDAELLSADLSTITAGADRILRVEHSTPYGLHLEFQAGHDSAMELRCLRYNVLAEYALGLPIHTVLVLLRPEADAPELTGRRVRSGIEASPYIDFRYSVVRLWQVSVESILRGGLGTLPLALLTDVSAKELPEVIEQMAERVETVNPDQTTLYEFWSAAYILAGLRFAPATLTRIFQGVRQMRESATYQEILKEGRADGRIVEARALLLRQGTLKFGTPTRQQRSRLSAIRSLARLETLAERLLGVETWEELFS